MSERAPLWLRPIHQWFFFWEHTIASIYRVVAVVVAAVITISVLAWLLQISWLVLTPLAFAAWVGLAIVQEHDERVSLPVDPAFLSMLDTHVTPALAAQGFDHFDASGPCRAHASRTESFLYQSSRRPEIIFIYRDPLAMTLQVSGTTDSTTFDLTGDAEADAIAVLRSLQP